MPDKNMIIELVNRLSQDVSYKLSDLIFSYPEFARPLVTAAIQACIGSGVQNMPEKARELYFAALEKMTVVSIPKEMDPRKTGGTET